jgi:hypothetical protein
LDHPLLLWSIRLALVGYFAAIGAQLAFARNEYWQTARAAWTIGCVLYVVHVLAAFHFAHEWRHSAAYDHTARQTQAMTGVNWGGGVWLNHLFTLVWIGDVALWWLAPQRYLNRPRWATLAVQGWLGFIAFNATVVFGQGWVRWLGVVSWLALAFLLWRCRRGESKA